MFEPGEAKVCPSCGLALRRLEDLPKAKVVDGALEPEVPPDEETLPWTYWRRGRGAMLLISVLGLAAFFLPWVKQLAPEHRVMNGPQVASYLGWMWAPFVSWLVMIPLVLSRRSVYRMRGARVAAAFLAAMSFVTVAVRVAFPPERRGLDPLILEWDYGLYVTGAISLVGIAVALTLGGRIDDLTAQKNVERRPDETLH